MRKKIYDWSRWFSLPQFFLRRGQNYRCSDQSIVQQVRNAACTHGKSIRIAEVDGGVEVLVIPKNRSR